MELVKGVPITEYCDTNKLNTRRRLGLFIPICRAVQHAHQKGIIHRDIKPSNVMITMHDGVPVPKVIDFGIARATQGRLTDKTLFTEYHHLVGTPEYMSPEQAEMSGLDVDTRTDVYGLGVLLYELLTGTTPFDSKTLRRAAYEEIHRIIREVEPPKPSTRISTLGQTLTQIAFLRQIEPKKLGDLMRGDLDWIVMKCLEKDRTRRYETANALALDIARHLENEPVTACPPSRIYRFRKMVRRNRLAFAATTIVTISLIVGALVSTWQAVRATRAKQETARALMNSEESRVRAEAVSKYLVRTFQAIDPYRDGRDLKMAVVLDRAVANLDDHFADSPTTMAELLDALGQAYTGLGMTAKGLALLEKAKAIDQVALGDDHPDTLGINIDIVQVYRIDRRLADAIPLLEETLKRSKAKFGPDARITLTTMKDLGDAYQSAGRPADAVRMLEDALKRCKAKLGADDRTTLFTMNNLAGAYRTSGRLADAIPLLEETLKLMKVRLGPDHRDTLNTTNNLANAYRAAGRPTDAVPMLEEALARCQARFGPVHPDTLNTMNNLTEAYRYAGRLNEAMSLSEETLKLCNSRIGPNDPIALRAAGILGTLCSTLLKQDTFTDAGPTPGQIRSAVERLIEFYDVSGKPAQASIWRTQLTVLRVPPRAVDRSSTQPATKP